MYPSLETDNYNIQTQNNFAPVANESKPIIEIETTWTHRLNTVTKLRKLWRYMVNGCKEKKPSQFRLNREAEDLKTRELLDISAKRQRLR